MRDDYDSRWRTKLILAAKAVDDGDGDISEHTAKPVMTEDLLGDTEYKFLPDRLRQMILSELVYCTDPITRIFPGCTGTMDSTKGRREAFWLSLCRCVLINVAKCAHSDVVEAIPASEDMNVHVSVFKKMRPPDYNYDVDVLGAFAANLGVFGAEAHENILKALKIGDKQPFVSPVDMTLENNTAAAKTAKASLMMTLPFRLLPQELGIKPAVDEDENEDDEDDEGDADESADEKRCHPMFVLDSVLAGTFKTLKKEFKELRNIYETEDMDMRTLVVTSPPWGVLNDSRAEPGGEDQALTPDQMGTLALGLADLLDLNAVVCLHLLPYDHGNWRKAFESTGKWTAYLHPVVLVASSAKGLTYFNKYQQANNVFSFLCLHRADQHPPVTADFLRDKPGMAKLMNALWNTGTIIPTAAVPKTERVSARVEKKLTYLRTQQLPAAVMRPLIRMFGRAVTDQPAVVVVDPFMGTGSTAIAARQLGCGFIGWDRDPVIVEHASEKFSVLSKVTHSHTLYDSW